MKDIMSDTLVATIEEVDPKEQSFDEFTTEMLDEQKRNDMQVYNELVPLCENFKTILEAVGCASGETITPSIYTTMVTIENKATSLKNFLGSLDYSKESSYALLDYFWYNDNNRIHTELLDKYSIEHGSWFLQRVCEHDPKTFLEHANKIDPNRLGTFLEEFITESNGQYDDRIFPDIMKYFSSIKTLPFAKKLLIDHCFDTASNSYQESFPVAAHIDTFKDQSYAEEVLKYMLTDDDDGYTSRILASAILKHAYCFIDKPYAQEIITQASQKNSYATVHAFAQIEQLANSTEIIKQAFATDPIGALTGVRFGIEYHKDYEEKNKEDKEESILDDNERVSELGTLFDITPGENNTVVLKTQKGNTICITLTKEGFSTLLASDESGRREITLLQQSSLLQHCSFYKELVYEIIQKNPIYCGKYHHTIKDLSYISDLLQIAAEKKPELCIEYYAIFKDLSITRTIIQNYLKNNPNKIKKILLGDDIEKKYAIIPSLEGMTMPELNGVNEDESPAWLELLRQHPAAISLLLYLIDKTTEKKLIIGKKEVEISLDKINLLSGLLYTQENIKNNISPNMCDANTKTERGNIITHYNNTLNSMLSAGKETKDTKNSTAILFAHIDNDDVFTTTRKDTLITKYREEYNITKVEDCIQGDTNNIPFEEFLKKVKKTMGNCKTLIMDIGGHGGEDGSVDFGKYTRTKENFNTLFELQKEKGCKLYINVTSCYSAQKLNTNIDTNTFLVMGASQNVGTIVSDEKFLDAYKKEGPFAEGDFDEDGIVSRIEAQTYKIINYNDSLMTVFRQDKSTRQRIVDTNKKDATVSKIG